MDKSSRYYRKAVISYNEGKIVNAMNYCEKSISLSLKNSAAVNLKGLLLYIKGELGEAEAVWKLNKDYNKDEVSKKYLENLESDKDNLIMYEKAEKLIGKMEFKEAFVLLKECLRSDFNGINVNNSLCKVFIHLGRYEEAKQCIEKVFSMDKYDKVARESKNLLIEYRVLSRDYYRRKVAIGLAIVFASGLFWWTSSLIQEAGKEKNVALQGEKVTKQVEVVIKQDSIAKDKEVEKKEVDNKSEEFIFPKEEINQAIAKKEYEKLFIKLQGIERAKLGEEEKKIVAQGEQLLKVDGVEYFYTVARKVHHSKLYKEALIQYERAEKYGAGNYLYPNVIFMMGDCYEALDQIDKAIYYYDTYLNSEYDSKYQYEYNATILYRLVIIHKDSDISKAKKYAIKLREQYSTSDYNNSMIKAILD